MTSVPRGTLPPNAKNPSQEIAAHRFGQEPKAKSRTYSGLENSVTRRGRFVSGHRFSDAAAAPTKSPLGAGGRIAFFHPSLDYTIS